MNNPGREPGATALMHERGEVFPLSSGQRRMWFWRQFAPDTALYNITIGLRLQGALDVQALESALRKLLERHEVLRGRWDGSTDPPSQRGVPLGDWSMRRHALESGSAAQLSEELERLARTEASRPFDLAREHGMRTTLVALGPEEHRLVWSLQHGLCDGRSIGVLLDELCELYAGEATGAAPALPQEPARYFDYAASEERWLASGVRDRDLAYWRSQLTGAPAVLELPTDRPRPREPRFRGASLPFVLDRAAFAAIRALAAPSRCTAFMALLAGWQTLLHRYSRQPSVVSGSVVANRGRQQFKRVVGYFANTVALRTEFPADLTVGELLRQIRTTVLAAHEHRELPFEEIVEALALPREPGRMPLLQAMITLEPPILSERRLGAARLTEVPIPHRTAASCRGRERRWSWWYREHFSVVFADCFVFRKLLGLEAPDLDSAAHRYLRLLEIEHKVDVRGGVLTTTDLSQGQRRRLALVTAYLEDRPFYVFDEWAADQDPQYKEVFYTKLLPELCARGKGVVVITHDDRYFHLGDRIVKLVDGRLATAEAVESRIAPRAIRSLG